MRGRQRNTRGGGDEHASPQNNALTEISVRLSKTVSDFRAHRTRVAPTELGVEAMDACVRLDSGYRIATAKLGLL